MRDITLRQDEVEQLTQEITLQQDQVEPLTRETSPASKLKYIRLEQIKHDSCQTTYVYGGELSASSEGAQVLKKMLKIAKDDLAPIKARLTHRGLGGRLDQYWPFRKLQVVIDGDKVMPRPLPKRQHDILMTVLAQSEHSYELALEHKRKLMNDPTNTNL